MIQTVALPGYMAKFWWPCWWSGFTEKRNLFPPGGTQFNAPLNGKKGAKTQAVRSPWREYEFWFMVLQHAIVPRLSINQALDHWPRIRARLMERPRKRRLQNELLEHFF